MYLHLGGETVIPQKSVVAVCDMDNATSSRLTRDFLRRAEKEGRVVNVAEDLPKSFVLCCESEGQVVYLSQLNSATLLKRAETRVFELTAEEGYPCQI